MTDPYANPQLLAKAPDASRIVFERRDHSNRECVENRRDSWKLWEKVYRGYWEMEEDNVFSNFVLPLIRAHIESAVPRIVANNPTIEVWERGPEDTEVARMHRAKLAYDWQHMRMAWFLANYAKYALIYGTAIGKVMHRRTVETRGIPEQRLSEEGRLERVIEARQLVTYDDPATTLCEIDRIYPRPGMVDFYDPGAWLIHEVPVSFSQIEAIEAGRPGFYDETTLKRLRAIVKEEPNKEDQWIEDYVRESSLETWGEARPSPDPFDRRFTLLEMWSAGQVSVVIRELPHLPPLRNTWNELGMIPFFRFTPIYEPNQFYGTSMAEVLFSLNLELNSLHNARMDHVLSAVHRIFSVLIGSEVNPEELRQNPRGYFYVGDHTDIQEREPARLDFSIYREEREIQGYAQRVGVPDALVGMEGRSSQTATEFAGLTQAAGTRLGLMFQVLDWQALTPLGKMLVRINEMHVEKPRDIPVIGPEIRQQALTSANPEEGMVHFDPQQVIQQANNVDRDVVISIATSEPETRQFRLQRAINALSSIGQIPPEQWMNPMVQRLGANILEGLGYDDGMELMQQAAQFAQQLLMLQMQVQGQPTQGGNGAGNSQAVEPGQQHAEVASAVSPAAQSPLGGLG